MTGDVRQGDIRLAGQRMLGRDDEIQWIVPDLHRQHRLGGLWRQGDHRQLGTAVQYLVIGHFRIEKTDIQADLRVRAGKGAQQRRQPMQADVMAGRQAQPSANIAVEVGQGTAGVVQYIQDLVGAGEQGAASFGETDVAAQPIEQAHIQLCFQRGDALAHRRLCQVEAFGGQRKAAGFRNCNKGVEVGEIHGKTSGWL